MTDDGIEEGKRSPLHEWHIARGAEIIWDDGWPWAMHVGQDPLVEYEAIRTATGLWDLFSTCKYVVTGPDASKLIQRRFTNDVAPMEVGAVRYGAFVNPDGLMVDEGNVYKHADDRYWAMLNRGDLEGWLMESTDGLNASVEHATERLPMIAVQGPTSRDLLQGLTDADLSPLKYFRCWPDPVKVAGVEAWVQRTGYSGEIGYEVVTDPAGALPLWEALVAARGTPFGLSAIDIARIEAGLLVMAVDYQSEETSPFDVSLDRFIKPGVGTVGDEALAAVAADPPKRLKTLEIESDEAPEAGAEVTRDGDVVGTVTSPIVSPRLGTIGLAILNTDAAVEGSKVEVAGAVATVAGLSLYDPEKKKPRG
jgi:aminomethyltransferase